jgi:molybdate transport system substrate-binding protein
VTPVRVRGRRLARLAVGASVLLLAAVLFAGCRREVVPEVAVAAAADLRFTLEDVIAAFSQAHPGLKVVATYGSSGNFYAQLVQGAPFDLFLSADAAHVEKLLEREAADPDDAFRYALGRLAVVSKRFDPARGLELVADPQVRHVAVAHPVHAPYGRAAMAALDRAGLAEAARPKLVTGDNVAQAAQLVEAGAADVGIVALGLSRGFGGRLPFAALPIEVHPPIEQAGVVLKRARDPDAARAFARFLTGLEARALLDRDGFLSPAETTWTGPPSR